MFCLRILFLPAVWLAGGLFCLSAQSTLPVASAIQQFSGQGGQFQTLQVFTPAPPNDPNASRFAPNAQFLTLNLAQLKGQFNTLPVAITLQLPYHNEILTIDLLETSLFTQDFSVLTSSSGGQEESYVPGRHYRGCIRGDGRSLAAFSIFSGEIMGLVADDKHGNIVLGKLDRPGNQTDYILYADREITMPNPFSCQTLEPELTASPPRNGDHPEVSGCVRVYFETDYELFQNKGSVQATVDYLAGAFNQLATLYANEQISVTLSQVFVWVTPDSYSNSSSSTALNQFKTLRKSYNGDIAQLVTIGGNNLGGIAYVDVLCVPSYAYAFSDISTSFSTVPTYSWTVEVLTHEMGHNLGSPHTQSCSWPGGAIDNCFTVEGNCAPGPSPVNGGTIMSYCHLTNYGINFNNGFGPLPGDKIRTEVSNASCLAASCAPVNNCLAPKNLVISNISANNATISWNTVSGATGYNLSWRPIGQASWSTITNAGNPYTLSGLPANVEIEVRVQSNCGSGSSDYSYGVIFLSSGSGSGSNCGAPGNLTATATSTSSALVTWAAVSGAASYQLSYKLASSSVWSTPVNLGGTGYTLTGLSAGATYNVRILANCQGALSTYASVSFTTKSGSSGGACDTPGNLTATVKSSSSVNVSWSSVPAANYYVFWYKLSSSAYWSLGLKIGGTALTLNSLAANTSYDIRVRAVCNSGNSGFATTTFTTQSGGGGSTCQTPGNFTLNYLASTSAIISWNPVSGASGYDLQIKSSSSGYWLTFSNLPATVVQITNLKPNSSYQARVRARCPGPDFSDYTTILTINTPANSTGEIAAIPEDEGVVIRLDAADGTADTWDVYPNPTTGWVTFSDASKHAMDTNFQWFDLNGRSLAMLSVAAGSYIKQFDMSQLPSGVYVVRVLEKDRQPVVHRVVKE